METVHEYSRPQAGERLIVIGRPRDGTSKPDLDLSPDAMVSRRHAVLVLQANGDYFLESASPTIFCSSRARGAHFSCGVFV
jgi:hypothetical protein